MYACEETNIEMFIPSNFFDLLYHKIVYVPLGDLLLQIPITVATHSTILELHF